MVMVIPPLTADYVAGKEVNIQEIAEGILEGDIGSNIKNMVFPDLINIIEPMLSNFEWAKSEATKNYQILHQAYVSMLEKDFASRKIQNLYSSVMNSNFTFSLKIVSTVLPILMLALRITPSPTFNIKQNTMNSLKSDLLRIVRLSTGEMPDSTSIQEGKNQYSSILASLVFGYNISLFLGLVFIVGFIVKHEVPLNKSQVLQFETLLRDWSQEAVAQVMLLLQKDSIELPFSFEGLPIVDEDLQIADEDLENLE